MGKPDLSLIIPAYNEAERIGKSIHQLAEYLDAHNLGTVEVIVVVAKSQDNTLALAESKNKLFRNFRVIDAGARVGKGRDVRLAMQQARGSYRLFMDADLATPLHHLETIKQHMAKEADVIIGVRNLKASHKGLRKFISSFGNILVRVLLGLKISDTQCGFKAFRGPVANDLFAKQTVLGWGFDMELLAIAHKRGYSIQTIVIDDWQDVEGGTFKNVAVQGAVSTLKDLLHIKWNLISGKYRQQK